MYVGEIANDFEPQPELELHQQIEGHQKPLTYNRTVFCAFWLHFLFLTPRILNLLKRTLGKRPNVTIIIAAVTFAIL